MQPKLEGKLTEDLERLRELLVVVDRLRPPLEPRVPEALEPLDPAALEDEGRYEASS